MIKVKLRKHNLMNARKFLLHFRLGCGRKKKRRSVMRCKLPEHCQTPFHTVFRQKLNLIQNHYTLRKIMEFAAAARRTGVKTFKKLHIGRYNNARIKIFRSKR